MKGDSPKPSRGSDVFPPIRLKEAWNLGGLSPRQVLMGTWTKLNDNEILTRASAVSFYAMLALVPILAILLTVLIQLLPDITGQTPNSTGFGNMTVGQLRNSLRSVLPEEGYRVVEDQITRIQKNPPFGLLSIGLVIALWTASSLFMEVMAALNKVYGVVETRSFIRLRQSAILLGALVAIVAGPEILQWLGYRGQTVFVASAIQWVVVAVMVLLSFALTFYIGPDAHTRWEWITPGSVLGTAVFLAFTLAFRVYIQRFANYDKTYGSLGGVMILLFWFWVSSLVLLTAGQTNKVIEEASPLGKPHGQKVDATNPPDFAAMTPKPL
jgi:membrane protein